MFSQTIMLGYIATDPELKTIEKGSHLLKFNLAVDREARSAAAKPNADFFPIEVWGGYAISLKGNLAKGDKVLVISRAVQRRFLSKTDPAGKTVKTCFTALQVIFANRIAASDYMSPPALYPNDFQQPSLDDIQPNEEDQYDPYS